MLAWATPVVHAVGDVLSASDWNTNTQLNAQYLYGDTVWSNAALQNGWVAFGVPRATPGYRLWGPNVQLRGTAKNGTVTQGTLLFTLSAGYLPAFTSYPVGVSAGAIFSVQVNTNGQVTINWGATASDISFDGMNFTLLA